GFTDTALTGGQSLNTAGSLTITITPTAIQNYNPAGFASISVGSTGGNPTFLTMDTGNNATLIAPILSAGTISFTNVIAAGAGSLNAAAAGSVTISGRVNLANAAAGGILSLQSVHGDISLPGGVDSSSSVNGGSVRLVAAEGFVAAGTG